MRWAILLVLGLARAAGAVLTIQAEALSCHEVQITWSDPEAHPGTLYEIARQKAGLSTWDVLVRETRPGERTYTDTTAAESTTYLYRLTEIGVALQCGDVTGDGAINIGDALAIAQYGVGLRACEEVPFTFPAQCDVNRDMGCNIGDALLVAQCAVGIRGCMFECIPYFCGGVANGNVNPKVVCIPSPAPSLAPHEPARGYTAAHVS